jgi:hypothetical protein
VMMNYPVSRIHKTSLTTAFFGLDNRECLKYLFILLAAVRLTASFQATWMFSLVYDSLFDIGMFDQLPIVVDSVDKTHMVISLRDLAYYY